MFPSLQNNAQQLVKKYGYLLPINEYGYSKESKYYLPVGSAMIVPVEYKFSKVDKNYLIASPTMFLPRDTKNVYYSFYVVLSVIYKFNKSSNDDEKIKTIVCPGLGTGG